MSYAYWDQISIVLAAILSIQSPYWGAPSQIASSRNCGYALRSRILKPEPWAPNLGPHPILSGPTNSAMSHKSDFRNQESGCIFRNQFISQIAIWSDRGAGDIASPQRIRTRAPRIVNRGSWIRNQESWALRPRVRASPARSARRIREANEEHDSR